MKNTISYQWIDTNEKLQTCCQQAQQQAIVMLDTEFVRIRSYYPKLGLLQMYDGQQVSLIDPLAISDFSPFVALLANTKVLKVLHACGEDLDVFQHYFKQMPEPMLDTQIISSFLGLGICVGFSKLVENYCQIELDKSSSRTDWLARPLTEKQCQYAAADVWFLFPVYQQLAQQLAQTPWQNAVQEECEQQKQKRLEEIPVEKAYQRIGNAWQLNRQELLVLQQLEKWRVEEAKRRDLALNFIVKEQSLWQIAKIQPKHTSKLLEFMHPNEVRIHGKKLLWIVEQANKIGPEHYPTSISRIIDEPNYKQDMKCLRKWVQEYQPSHLSPEIFCNKRQLEQLFKWKTQGQPSEKVPELLKGWRAEFGQKIWEKYTD
ncbi:MAG: ribonuclease D [Pasteurellaceae bacterium]|nr:ribonuclease D [Pasteurellaceae bacterium]